MYDTKRVNERKMPIIKYEPNFRVIRHALFITDLALIFFNPARRMILGGLMYTWLDKIIFK